MSLIKLAVVNHYYIINPTNPPANQTKNFSSKDAIALGVGTSTGFTAGEIADHYLGKQLLKHRFAGKLGQVAAGTLGTVGTYKLLNYINNKKNKRDMNVNTTL